jgi:hypothetical protein
LLEARAGRDKGYAANFAKLDKGYLRAERGKYANQR